MTDFLIQVTCAAHTPLALGVSRAEAPRLRVDRWIAPPILVIASFIGGTIIAVANHFLGAH
jgi:hypothetical protein